MSKFENDPRSLIDPENFVVKFDTRDIERSTGEQSVFTEKHLLPWAIDLQDRYGSNIKILDASAGMGEEVSILSKYGIDVISLDLNPVLIDREYNPIQASMTEISLASESVHGIFSKDTLVFLNSWQKNQFAQEISRVLIPSGGLLIQSQVQSVGEIKFVYIKGMDSDGRLIYASAAGRKKVDEDDWIETIEDIQSRSDQQITSIQFHTTADTLSRILTSTPDIHITKIKQYDRDSPEALENRWVQTSGFIITARKLNY